MEGFYFGVHPCRLCGQPFPFNPHFVPVLEGQPVCGPCVAAANELRASHGLAPWTIHPKAYEPVDEREGLIDLGDDD